MENGIVFYNTGVKCLPRLLVSIHSLRKYYGGGICIVSSSEDGSSICENIGIEYNCVFKKITSDISEIKNHYFFEKARIYLHSPFDRSIFLDSDTVTLQNPSDIFNFIDDYGFVATHFAEWYTNQRIPAARIKQWEKIDTAQVSLVISTPRKYVNVGVFGFNKTCDMVNNWYDFTIKNKEAVTPEETSCNILLGKYKSIILPETYNTSCKYGKVDSNTKIIHYHGNKHCRTSPNGEILFNGDIWVEYWNNLFRDNTCNVKHWYLSCGDKHINNLIKNYKEQ